MPDGHDPGDHSLDALADGFRSLERALGRRTARTTRSREDANAIRALFETWTRTYKPQLAKVLGDFAAIESVDRQVRELRSHAGFQLVIVDVRGTLRAIARTLDREILPAYDAARWTSASTTPASPTATAARATLEARLQQLSPDLASSYRQVHMDIADTTRETYIGPAGELREVMRGAIHLLAPDQSVEAQDWYIGDRGRPTQAERIRYIVQEGSGGGEDAPIEAADVVETKVGRLGRTLYSRASRAVHAGTERDEVERIVAYIEAVLNEILPPLEDGS
jgi:Predicted pPIWI-associating nuclease